MIVGAGTLGAGALLAKLGDFVPTVEAKGEASVKWPIDFVYYSSNFYL